MVKVTFNGTELTKYITVLDGFTLFGGADFDPKHTENSIVDGSEFEYTRKKHKTISMPFFVDYKNESTYDLLQSILNVNEPKELTFDIYPNRVFYAIPSGDLDFDEYKFSGKGKINFVIVDGLAHSKTTRTFEFSKNSQGALEAEIINEGSEEVTVNYEIKLKKESGFVGIVSEYGAMQFGKVDEADGYTARKNVTVLSNQKGNFANWTDGNVFYENPKKIVTTQMSSDAEFGGRLGLLPDDFTTSGTSGAICRKNGSETTPTDMPLAVLGAGELRFLAVDYNENLKNIVHHGLSDPDFGAIRFEIDAELKQRLTIMSSGYLNFTATNYTEWKSTGVAGCEYMIQGRLVIVNYDVTFNRAGTHTIGGIPQEFTKKTLMMTAKAWSILPDGDRNIQLNPDGSMHILNAEANVNYRGTLVFSY